MDISIEKLKDSIYNQKTKVYFEEVFSSYLVQSYRSALVMLWTVLICDLWFKISLRAFPRGLPRLLPQVGSNDVYCMT